MEDKNLELSYFIDPFWLEHGEEIRRVKKAVASPNTPAGKEELKRAMGNPNFMVYNRIRPIFGALVSLIEYEEIDKRGEGDYFSDKINQRVILRALGLLIEENIKFPYGQKEQKTYKDYQRFFKSYLKRLQGFDSLIEKTSLPNFNNSMVRVFIQEINDNLRGVQNFNIQTDKIRSEVVRFLPELEKIEGGKVLAAIKEKLFSSSAAEAKKQGKNLY